MENNNPDQTTIPSQELPTKQQAPFEQQPSADVPEKKQSKLSRIPVYAIASLILFALGAFGFWAYQEKLVKKPTASPTPTTTPSAIPTPKPTPMPTSTPEPTIPADWQIYLNEEYGFEISYPDNWTINKDSYAFKEGGDLFSIYILGKTQKKDTELYDGASLTIGHPLKIAEDVETWVKEYYGEKNIDGEPNEFSQEIINELVFQKVFICGLGCSTYYNTKKDNYVYRLIVSVVGLDEKKYKQTGDQILSTFKFID